MDCTLALADLQRLVSAVDVFRPRAKGKLTLSACAGRLFVEFNGDIAGTEALVISDGSVRVPARKFAKVLDTYGGVKFLNLVGGREGLRIQTFTMKVTGWNPHPIPPADFSPFLAPRANATGSSRL